ncbi:MAG: IclR family transcriptional regulator [Terriglobia bacterium]
MNEITSKPQRRRRPKAGIAGLKGEAGLAEQYYSKTIGRALDALECFSDEKPFLSLKEIGRLVHLPEPSLFRILLTLESRGYLKRDADGSYRLSRKLLFGKLLERAERLMRLVRPELQKLASRFNETASLAYLFEDRIQALDTVETFHEVRVSNKPGRVIPPHCSALGKAITAFQDQALTDRILEVYGLTPRTANTIVDRQALLAEFERIRDLGYSMDREESVAGGICIGAPIRVLDDRVIAALSVSTPKVRMTPEREQEVIHAVMESARKIEETLRARKNLPPASREVEQTLQEDPDSAASKIHS